MNKRFTIALLLCTAILLLSSCSPAQDIKSFTEAAENTNSSGMYKATFFISISPAGAEEEDSSYMFAQGEISVDRRDKLLLSGVMTQYAFGETSAVNLYYEDGKYYTDLPTEGIKSYTETTDENLKGQFIFSGVPVFDAKNIKSVKTSGGSTETTYSFKLKDAASLERLLGENIYLFVGAGNPDTERTKFGEANCEFVIIDNGGKNVVKSFDISYNVTVYNKKPYVPDVKYDDKDFRFDNLVTLRMNFSKYGDDVEIAKPGDLDKYILDTELDYDHEESE